mmetsp:Transcript_653/g.1801  ORF Transcript_653/g.1801 Transcript_653/m.1801 type:complete len:467 (-) Transcript_653:527-1927(-)
MRNSHPLELLAPPRPLLPAVPRWPTPLPTPLTWIGHQARLVHAVHPTAAAAAHLSLGLGDLADEHVCGKDRAGDGGGVLDAPLGDLRRVEYAVLNQILVLVNCRVVAPAVLRVFDRLQHHRTVHTRVSRDLLDRCGNCAEDNLRASHLVFIRKGHLRHNLFLPAGEVGQRRTAARNDARLEGALDGVESVLVAELLVLKLRLRRSAHLDARDGTAELGDALLRLLNVELVVTLRLLLLDELDASGDRLSVLASGDDGGGFLADHNALSSAEHLGGYLLHGEAELLRHEGRARQHRDVLHVHPTPVAKAGSLDGHHIEHTAHLVKDKRGESLARHVVGDDHERLLELDYCLEEGDHLAHVGELAVRDQDARLVQLRALRLLVLDEVGRRVATVDLHPLGEVDLVGQHLPVLDGGGAEGAHLLEGGGDDAAHLGRVCGDRSDGAEVLVSGDGLCQLCNLRDDHFRTPV